MIDPSDAPTMRSKARIGLVLRDKWRIDSILGVGGMAVVYTATHTNNGRRVALKMLHPELSMNPELRNRFLREGYVANKVAHPGSVAVLDDDIAEDGSVFLVMELLEGETIEARRIRHGNILKPTDILALCDQVLDVLAAAHEKGVVHRDVKPDNVFLTRDGSVKLLDFGIARIRELTGSQATMTGTGAMGTPAFMPPEQARGRWEQVGTRTDIWALGATMFTLATGLTVHTADTLNEMLLAAMTKPAPALASVFPGLPPPFCALIDRALAYDPGERWPDARTMQNALREAYQAISAGDGPTTNRGVGGKPVADPSTDGQGRAGPMANEPTPHPVKIESISGSGPRPFLPGAMSTGPRPPPDIRKSVPNDAPSGAHPVPVLPSVPQPPPSEPTTTSGVVLVPGHPSQPRPHAVYPTPAGRLVLPSTATHATSTGVTMGPRKGRAGAGLAIAAGGVISLVAALGLYRVLRSDPAPATGASAAAATQSAPASSPATATAAPSETAAPTSPEPSSEPAASAEPSSSPAKEPAREAARPPTPAAQPRPKPAVNPPKPRPPPAQPAKSERDLLNRRN